MVVAWAEYNTFFQETKDTFALTSKSADINYMRRIIPQYRDSSFWMIIEDEKMDSNGNSTSAFAKDMLAIFDLCKEKREIVTTSELSTLTKLTQFNKEISRPYFPPDSAQPDPQMPILMQVVAIPLLTEDRPSNRGIIIGKILNNDNSIVDRIDQLFPGTNSTISVRNGLRISGNIKSKSHESFIGKLQEKEHIEAVYHGNRYYGQIALEDLNDKIISEPIYNNKKEIIGALTTGFPYLRFASLKQQVTIYILSLASLLL